MNTDEFAEEHVVNKPNVIVVLEGAKGKVAPTDSSTMFQAEELSNKIEELLGSVLTSKLAEFRFRKASWNEEDGELMLWFYPVKKERDENTN